MASQKNIIFYEKNLPHELPESNQWLYKYHKNSKDLVTYISMQGFGTHMYYATIKCLTELRNFLLDNEIIYSNDNAIQWLERFSHYPDGFKITLLRLIDLYSYGNIQPVNEFKHIVPYENNILEPWSSILTGFLDTVKVEKEALRKIKNRASRFIYAMQKQNIMSPCGITYDILEAYLHFDGCISPDYYAAYVYTSSDILQYMSDNRLCSPGLGWYPYFRMHNRIFKITEFTNDQINKIYQLKPTTNKIQLYQLNDSIKDFLEKFKSCGYSFTQYKSARYTLYNLLLFIDMNKLNYSNDLAKIWLEHEKIFHQKSDSWTTNRKILYMFDDYLNSGKLNLHIKYIKRPIRCELLPEWCRCELDNYMQLKIKENWKALTLNMIRASVTKFCNYLVKNGFTNFSQITPDILKDFNLSDMHSTVESKNAYNSRIRKFIQYLERKNIVCLGINRALLAKAASREKIVVVLTDREKEVIRTKLQLYTSPLELRDKAMLLLGLKMGLRSIDIVEINLMDIDWNAQILHIIQKKTDHEIILPIPTDVANAIYIYITKGRPNNKTDSKKLFIKHNVPYNGVSSRVCRDALTRILPERKIYGSGFHVTRKTYATDKLNNGVGKQGVADLLGHSDTTSLTPYLLLDSERMRMCPISLSEAGLLLEGI